jgi:cyclic pyranopterin phosphate synthase
VLDFISISVEFGISKIRFTGGEPLLRPDICEIIREVRKTNGIEKICVTTNGLLLGAKAAALKNAGLDAVNISLDSLDAKRFEKITGSGKFYEVIEGIYAALDYGLDLKLNAVVLDDLFETEVDRFVSFAISNPVAVRFIELMPVSGANRMFGDCPPESWHTRESTSAGRIENYVRSKFKFSPCGMDGVARTYKTGGGLVGFISPLSHPFCGDCNRLRLSSDGLLYRCLFDSSSLDVKPFLTCRDYNALYREIKGFVAGKKKSHFLNKKDGIDILPLMKSIGG